MTQTINHQPQDIAAEKKSKIEHLKQQLINARLGVSRATAKYNSFVHKAETFAEIRVEAEVKKANAQKYWDLLLKVKEDLHALDLSTDAAEKVANTTLDDARQLSIQWDKVTKETIKAVEAIDLTTELIEKKAAMNPLISHDLILQMEEAKKKGMETLNLVVSTLEKVLNLLTAASQASRSTALVGVFKGQVKADVLAAQISRQRIPNFSPAEEDTLRERAKETPPLETLLNTLLQATKTKAKQALIASENATEEMHRAKEELAQAKTNLIAREAALKAAQSAVGS